VFLDRFPLTGNGKVDRTALAADSVPDRQGEARTAVAAVLALLWCDLLGVGTVGPDDDFFALGGHSLLVSRLRGLIRRTLRVDVPLLDLFDRTTVREQVEAVLATEHDVGRLVASAATVRQFAATTGEAGDGAW